MIFCFSGTGNSLHMAERIAKELDDNIVMITESEVKGCREYHVDADEKIGFVYPIYWWGMPLLVEDFIRKMKISGYAGQYVYAVCTYGLSAHNGLYDLKRLLISKKIVLSATYEVKMVDNYIVGYELKSKKIQQEILLRANEKIPYIIESIKAQESHLVKDGVFSLLKPLVHSFYKKTNHQKDFFATDDCVGCGLCEQQCPCGVIRMKENKPVWENNCSFCLKCIHTCPKQAVQYKNTKGRMRYSYDGVCEKELK